MEEEDFGKLCAFYKTRLANGKTHRERELVYLAYLKKSPVVKRGKIGELMPSTKEGDFKLGPVTSA